MTIIINPREDEDSSIFSLCEHLSLEGVRNGGLHIDLRHLNYISLGTMTAVAMLMKTLKMAESEPRGTYNPRSDMARYMSRMNFFEVTNTPKPEDFTRHSPKNNFMEISIIDFDENANYLPNRLTEIVKQNTTVDKSLVEVLNYSFGEIIDNVSIHAHSDVGGCVSAQCYPKKGYVEFCVIDCGIGIVSSLGKNPNYTTVAPEELIVSAFEKGVGEAVGTHYNTPGYGKGMGLVAIDRLVEAAGGELWCVSHDYAVHISNQGKVFVPNMYFPGTALCARIPLTAKIDETEFVEFLVDFGDATLVSWEQTSNNGLW